MAAFLLLLLVADSRPDESRPDDARPDDARPNILFLLADDLATSGVGCYGHPYVRTPHIDALAADGVRFERHYVTTAICMASRASVFTGLYEYRHGCNFHTGPLSEADWRASYPVLLRDAGYATAFAGKFGLTVGSEVPGGGETPDGGRLPAEDFDRWGGGPGQTFYATARNPAVADYASDYPHASRAYGAFGADFVRVAAAGDRPFSLSVSFKAPHRPVSPDPTYDDWYVAETFPRPANFGRAAGRHLPPHAAMGRQYPRFNEWGYADRYDAVMADYFRLIAGVDAAVGMIRGAIEEAGVGDHTVVIFTSDNGYLCGSHGLASKVLPYEESTRVPLIIVDPAADGGGRTVDALTASVDFAATILDYAGVDDPADRDGRSLRPLINGEAGRPTRSIPLIDTWNPPAARSLAVVREDSGRVRKTILWPGDGDGLMPTLETYDLRSDPAELSPVATTVDDRSSIEAALADWSSHAGERYRDRLVQFTAAAGHIRSRNLRRARATPSTADSPDPGGQNE